MALWLIEMVATVKKCEKQEWILQFRSRRLLGQQQHVRSVAVLWKYLVLKITFAFLINLHSGRSGYMPMPYLRLVKINPQKQISILRAKWSIPQWENLQVMLLFPFFRGIYINLYCRFLFSDVYLKTYKQINRLCRFCKLLIYCISAYNTVEKVNLHD